MTTDFLPPNVHGIPELLRQHPRWVLWSLSPDGRKVPNAAGRPGTPINATDPANWCSYQLALNAFLTSKVTGLGFALGRTNNGLNFAGVDIDDCRDPQTGVVEPWALSIVRELDSYAEVSPSGRGIKIFLLGTLPDGASQGKRAGIEIYDRARYFAVTGRAL